MAKEDRLNVRLTFTEPLLGTMSGNREIAEDFILGKHPDAVQKDEKEALPEEEIEKSSTIFSKVDDQPVLWDYQIKGFFKDACSMLNRLGPAMKAHKKVIDGLVFVFPRKIPLKLSGALVWMERPLRGQTAKGERIALARSETAPIGTKIEIEILLLDSKLKVAVEKWLDYGALRGIGQWRNASWGRFTWEYI